MTHQAISGRLLLAQGLEALDRQLVGFVVYQTMKAKMKLVLV